MEAYHVTRRPWCMKELYLLSTYTPRNDALRFAYEYIQVMSRANASQRLCKDKCAMATYVVLFSSASSCLPLISSPRLH
jgi:hypothetical protein